MGFRYYIAGDSEPLTAAHPQWTHPLPVSPGHFGDTAEAPPTITHGDYFTAVGDYLSGIGASHLAAAGQVLDTHPERQGSWTIAVVLEKHGAFYHPARLVFETATGQERWLALNVAVTPVGLEVMASEVDAIPRVRPRLPEGALPRVFGQGRVNGPGGLRFGMFLTEWLRGFHEFHLARGRHGQNLGIRVWDPLTPELFLNPRQQAELYRQAAELLARAYDPESTAQVYPWHHASGDFVVHVDGAGIALKLISVRQYAPTLVAAADGPPDAEGQGLALLVFFLNTTLRLRVDRLEGTGPLAWAGATSVPAAVQGFFSGLAEPWRQILKQRLADFDQGHYLELLQAVAARYELMPGESALFAREIEAHAAQLFSAVKTMLADSGSR